MKNEVGPWTPLKYTDYTPVIASSPLEIVAIDIFKYASTEFLTLMDLYFELAWVYELPDYKQSPLAATFDLWRSSNCLAGYPKLILSDRGDEFNLIDCPRLKTSANHPQANGKLERFHQDLAVSSRVQKCYPVMAVKTMRTDNGAEIS